MCWQRNKKTARPRRSISANDRASTNTAFHVMKMSLSMTSTTIRRGVNGITRPDFIHAFWIALFEPVHVVYNRQSSTHQFTVLRFDAEVARNKQCSARVSKRAWCQFKKNSLFNAAFDDKKAPMTVVSAFFYQHFNDYFVMVTCLTSACLFVPYSRLQIASIFWEKDTLFVC